MASRTRAIWMSVGYLKNSFAPVNRLPPEVLGLIPSSFHSKRDLINATAVCRHWRNALLSTPDLWCAVDCSGAYTPLREHMFRECLERSRSVPLNVRLTSVRHLPNIAPHLPRFASLEIQLAVREQLEKIAAHFSQPAPLLQHLTISAAATMAQGTLSLSPALFGGELVALRTLRLAGFSALKTHPHFPRLTRFDLEARSVTRFKIDGLLDVLANMPLLEALCIRFPTFSRLSTPVAPSPRLVTLPKLKEVEISVLNGVRDSSPVTPYIPPLLSALILPSVERVTIGLLPPRGSAALPSSFEQQLPSFAETATVDVYAGPGVLDMLFHGRRGSKLLLSGTYCGTFEPRFEREGFCGTPFLSVKKLVVTFERFSPGVRKNFFELLGAVERLESLEIRGKHTHEVLRLWSWLEQRTICPSLQSLVVVKNPSDSFHLILTQLEAARKSCGVPFAEVVEVASDV
ncbi:hypothetical protein BJ322DRAFT_105104 [Thelephora terrestris]|uniref:F-box domain-containing protein n=1 Tax=Thelephora terrestris TaxID=56493 RepID=A0A9P6HRJ7_9AGAM|nr:hypothetical protein BJ322DRAFT_105104 [Thelephora terrestris]